MLETLFLKDFAVASEVEIAFGPGLGVVSGETGAGKSLMVDALLLLTGARADAGMVRHGAARAELVAGFRPAPGAPALAWLREQDLDEDGGCQLRRVIRADGGSKAWINGRPATASQLAELGALLVEVHGQHEHQALLSRAQQLDLLDAFGQHPAEREAVRAAARRWAEAGRKLAALAGDGDPAERIAWLEHQVGELDDEALDAAAIEDLLALHRRQANAAGLLQGCELALGRLGGDEGFAIGRGIVQVAAELRRLAADEPRLAEAAELLEGAGIQVDEAVSAIERARDGLELDPDRLAESEARLTRLHELGRKHRCPIEGLAARRDAIHAELEALRDATAGADQLQAEQARAAADWRAAAAALSQRRAEAAARLGAAVSALMDELGMAGGRFEASLEPIAGTDPDPQGAERAEFLVAANPGQPARPLRKVASGGELSRISLAIEVAALGLDAVPTMVFDEVDTGIGGGVAEVVGAKLRALGAGRQVLCVTHLPQVAAQGHVHYRVSKHVEDGHTHTRVLPLDEKARVEELARMLGGLEITRETRAHARQMLERGQAAG